MTNESKVRIAELEKQTEEKRIKNTQYHAYSGNTASSPAWLVRLQSFS